MFKPTRWWSEKNKIKVVFKLQFHASQVTGFGGEALTVSIVPADTGKPSIKSDKAIVRGKTCVWENPLYETVKFTRDPKSDKLHDMIYYFIVGTGSSSKAGVVGEASLDLSNYAETNKVSLVSLPLKNSKTESLLHVSIQRLHESDDQRDAEESETEDLVRTIKSNSVEAVAFDKTISDAPNQRGSSESDVTISSSESSCGVVAAWEPELPMKNEYSAISTDRETFPDQGSEKTKAALSRQVEMYELELQTLRKQIMKDSKRGQDVVRELTFLKEERDAFKHECEKLRRASSPFVEELRQELNHANELNANLRIQLQKTQEANSELLLAVQDLDDMLEQKNREAGPTHRPNDDNDNDSDSDDDEEQKALEEIVREHSDAKEAYLLEQQIMDLRSEIEMYKRDREELEMQMEQLALDYEIMKQENHDLWCKLEQSQIKEQLKMQYDECSSPNEEIEYKMERISELEEEIEKQARGFEADLEALTRSKVEQEQRAIKAEETLKQIRWKNANTAERLQEEFRRLSAQMASTFEANEKVATKAIAEANELRLEKFHLEEMLRKTCEEHHSTEEHYNALSNEVLKLKDELEMQIAKNKILSDNMDSMETLKLELKQMRISMKEMELVVEQRNDEQVELESKLAKVKNEGEGTHEELRKQVKEKEMEVANLESELKQMVLEHEEEKEKLRKQVVQYKMNVKKKEDAYNVMERKMKAASKTSKAPPPRGSKEVAILKERIKVLEVQQAAVMNDTEEVNELKHEIGILRERNRLMEGELKEMQGRYSEVSLKFAEVEGERQQLVMKLRNVNKSP